jgi:Questin oxidase-like
MFKMSQQNLDILFPSPSPPPSKLSPSILPGNNLQSTSALQRCLRENHEKFHIFFNDQGFHNHTIHHLLTIWALGGTGPVIEAAYDVNASYQRLASDSPEAITSENLYDHLGDEK